MSVPDNEDVPDREEILRVDIYQCKCGEEFVNYVTEHHAGDTFREMCQCDCQSCGLDFMTSRTPKDFFEKPADGDYPKPYHTYRGDNRLPKSQRGFNHCFGTVTDTVADLKEMEEETGMEYAKGEDPDEFIDDEVKQLEELKQ